jgi:hypothetical protein
MDGLWAGSPDILWHVPIAKISGALQSESGRKPDFVHSHRYFRRSPPGRGHWYPNVSNVSTLQQTPLRGCPDRFPRAANGRLSLTAPNVSGGAPRHALVNVTPSSTSRLCVVANAGVTVQRSPEARLILDSPRCPGFTPTVFVPAAVSLRGSPSRRGQDSHVRRRARRRGGSAGCLPPSR